MPIRTVRFSICPESGLKQRFPVDKLRLMESFICVARARNLTNAAHSMKMTPSAVSKQMSLLEALLGTQLLIRNRAIREVLLTPAGHCYLAGAVPALQQLRELEEGLATFEQPGGILRVSASKLLATHLVVGGLADFSHRFEGVTVRIVEYGDDEDIAITIDSKPARRDWLADQGASSVLSVLGTETWVILAVSGSPLTSIHRPSDLFGSAGSLVPSDDISERESWFFCNGAVEPHTIKQTLLSSNPEELITAAQGGSFVFIPLWAAHTALRSGQLVRVLPDWDVRPATGEASLMAHTPRSRANLPSVKEFIKHLQRLIGGMQARSPFGGS